MTGLRDDEIRDRIASDILSEWMINKVVTEVIVSDNDGDEDTCSSVAIKFSDETSFIIYGAEDRLDGVVHYLCCLPPKFIEGECPDHD